jgi:hypothetical protein
MRYKSKNRHYTSIMRYFLSAIAVVILFSSCEETIELDLRQTEPVLVVDALLTNQYTMHYVKLSKTIGYYDKGDNPGIKQASVRVVENAGITYDFTYSEDAAAYLSVVPFAAVPGNFYELFVEYEDKQFYASDTLQPIGDVEDMKWRINERQKQRPWKEGYYFEVLISAEEPQHRKDFYLFHFYRNDTLQRYDDKTGLFFSDDTAIGERIDNMAGPVFYSEGDHARFEIMSLTASAYRYYSHLSSLINNDGGMFTGIPANPRSNVQGNERVMGLFQVSAVAEASIVVGDPEFELK